MVTPNHQTDHNNNAFVGSIIQGYNVLILSFLLAKGPADQVMAWKQLSSSARTALKKSYNDAGITLMLSTFGSTDAPTTEGKSATALAKTHAAFVKEYGIQGIDVDYEGEYRRS